MPKLDGLETVRRIRAIPAYDAIRVLMVTARADSDRSRARDLGANNYLTKPFDPARLVALVRELAEPDTTRI
jgi:DNA-binding response OmpR family regulator